MNIAIYLDPNNNWCHTAEVDTTPITHVYQTPEESLGDFQVRLLETYPDARMELVESK